MKRWRIGLKFLSLVLTLSLAIPLNMVVALEREFRNMGLICMDLMVDADNLAAQDLYGELGLYRREHHLIKELK